MKHQKSPDELRASIILWRTVSAVLFFTMFFVGMGNVTYSNQVKALEKKYGIKKAKSDFYKNKYDDLIHSGTCLDRLPATAP